MQDVHMLQQWKSKTPSLLEQQIKTRRIGLSKTTKQQKIEMHSMPPRIHNHASSTIQSIQLVILKSFHAIQTRPGMAHIMRPVVVQIYTHPSAAATQLQRSKVGVRPRWADR